MRACPALALVFASLAYTRTCPFIAAGNPPFRRSARRLPGRAHATIAAGPAESISTRTYSSPDARVNARDVRRPSSGIRIGGGRKNANRTRRGEKVARKRRERVSGKSPAKAASLGSYFISNTDRPVCGDFFVARSSRPPSNVSRSRIPLFPPYPISANTEYVVTRFVSNAATVFDREGNNCVKCRETRLI